MKQAILVQCHKNPKQVNLLLDALDDPNLDIYVHIDKKSNIGSEIKTGKQIHILPDDVPYRILRQIQSTYSILLKNNRT